MLIPLTEKLYVAPQITEETVAEAARQGVSLIINNRPEGEAPDQTAGERIAAAVRAAGTDPDLAATLAAAGVGVRTSTPAEFVAAIAEERAKVAAIAQAVGTKPAQ